MRSTVSHRRGDGIRSGTLVPAVRKVPAHCSGSINTRNGPGDDGH